MKFVWATLIGPPALNGHTTFLQRDVKQQAKRIAELEQQSATGRFTVMGNEPAPLAFHAENPAEKAGRNSFPLAPAEQLAPAPSPKTAGGGERDCEKAGRQNEPRAQPPR